MSEENEILRYAIEHGMIDLTTICQNVEMNKREKALSQHKSNIWQDNNGYYITYVPDKAYKNGRRLIKRKVMVDLENALVEFYCNANAVYFFECLKEWANRKLEYGEILKQTYDRYIYEYQRYIEDSRLDAIPLNRINEKFLEDYVKTLIHDNQMTMKRWNNVRCIIAGTLKYAKRQGYTSFDVAEFFAYLELPSRMFKRKLWVDEEQVFSAEEVKQIENYYNNRPYSIINQGILFAFQTGLRAGELSSLKHSDISGNILSVQRTEERFKDDSGHYIYEVRESTKGKDGCRKVVLTPKALEIYNTIKREGEYIFMSKGQRLKGRDFSLKLYKTCQRIGITARSLHKIRKTYATNLLNAGIDEKIIERQMGHTDIMTTKNYYYFNNRKVEEIADILTQAIN